jgi:ribonuclease HI
MSTTTIELWTDGACSGNPGPGGWAAVLVARHPDGTIAKQTELSGGARTTTNNRMELQAVISGLRSLERPTTLTVHIDSTYVMDAIVKRWYVGWKARGWKLVEQHTISWRKVKGHAGIELNERCDELAVLACRAA